MPTKRTKSQERDRKRRHRLNEDDEAKTRRLEDDKIRHNQARELESVEEKEARLVDKRSRQQQAREIRKEEVLFLAKTKDVEPFHLLWGK